MSRRYFDSKVINSYKRYRDAMRRYRDAEERAEASKLSVMVNKINQKLSQFKNEHPAVAKLVRVLLKISSVFDAIGAGTGASLLVARLTPLLGEGKQILKYYEAGGILPKPIVLGLTSVFAAISSFIKWTLARKLEPDADVNARTR